jgi:hypothetical protein
MSNGWIKIHRCLLDKAFIKDAEKLSLWIVMLMLANHKVREEMFKGKPFKCQPGQFTIGRNQLVELTGIDRNKIERTLTYFEKIEQQIEQQTCNKNRLITIKNWDLYQLEENEEQQNEQQVSNNRATSEHTTRMKEGKKSTSSPRKRSKKVADPQHLSAAEEFMNGNLNRWQEIISLWKPQKENYLEATRNKYWNSIPKETQEDVLQFLRSIGTETSFLSNVWISTTLKEKNFSREWIQEKVRAEKEYSARQNKKPGAGLVDINNIKI